MFKRNLKLTSICHEKLFSAFRATQFPNKILENRNKAKIRKDIILLKKDMIDAFKNVEEKQKQK